MATSAPPPRPKREDVAPSAAAVGAFLASVVGAEVPHGALAFGKFDEHALAGLTLVSTDAAAGKVVARLPLGDSKLNRFRTLHGGCTATLIDVVGTCAVILESGAGGVSQSLSVDYLAPVAGLKAPADGGAAGATTPFVYVTATALKVGRSIAVVEVRLHRADGVLAAIGRLVKHVAATPRVATPAPKEP